ncbi:MAG TPA: DNA polymerase III subunit delta [Mollicutes bacterium]|nr:DNA polymerase III subunit delta [Mollicutes bacterium]
MNVYLIKSVSLRILNEELKKIIKDITNIIRVNMDEFSLEDLISECSYFSIDNEDKVVIANNFKVNKDTKGLEEYLKNPNKSTTLILVSENIDKRSSLYKFLNKNAKVIIIDEIKNMNNIISTYAKNKNIDIDYSAINKLLDHNLNNLDLALNEIDKISLTTNKITNEVVDKYSKKIITEENFDFSDAIVKKEYGKIEKYLDEFITLKQEISPFIGLLAGQFRLIYAVKALGATNKEIAELLNVHIYRVKLAKDNSILYTMSELEKILLDLCELDYNLKTSNIDKYILFKIFVINI